MLSSPTSMKWFAPGIAAMYWVALAGCLPSREQQAAMDRPLDVAMRFGPDLRLPRIHPRCVERAGVHACPDAWPLREVVTLGQQNATCIYTPDGTLPSTAPDEHGVPRHEVTVCCMLAYPPPRRQNGCAR
jgi:hypothetical protein